MERPMSSDGTPRMIERVQEVIDRSVGAEIPLWATQLHEAPFANEVNLSYLCYYDFDYSNQFDAFLKNDALGKKDRLGNDSIEVIKKSVRQLVDTITDPEHVYSRKPNSLTVGDVRTLKDGVIRRMGLYPFQVFIVRKLFGYESEDGLEPRDWARNLKSIGIPIHTPDIQLIEYFNGIHREQFSETLDTVLPNNVRHVGKEIVFKTLQMISLPIINGQSANVNVMGSSLSFLLGEGLLDEFDRLDTVTRKTIVLRLLC